MRRTSQSSSSLSSTPTCDVSTFAANSLTVLGLGMAVDYSLLMVSRFREQLAAGSSTRDAVIRTVETAGRTITFGAVTVAEGVESEAQRQRLLELGCDLVQGHLIGRPGPELDAVWSG